MKRVVRLKELHDKDPKFPALAAENIGVFADLSNSVSFFGLNYGMFEACIKFFGSDEQQKEYLPKIAKMEISGCYAQTEIGHGSDVQSLETTATYDKETDSFLINSPTITSGKFWPGELGKTATHAIFHAQLIIKDKNYGVQAFLCRIRDEESHRPLKGLEIGDIGPKGGYQQKDNGYMYFKNFVIPRTAILSKYTNVDRNGKFSVKGNPKFAYASMMFIRLYLVGVASKYTNKGLLIAIRYGIFRKQFKTLDNGKTERKLLDYQAHQVALTPILAFSFASLFTRDNVYHLFREMMEATVKKNDFKLMKEIHCILSCLKAHYTDKTLDYLKTIRECCGGLGFSQYSGIPNLIEIGAPNVTLEGENSVMYQQTARTLLKSTASILRGKQLTGSFAYINDIMAFHGRKLKKFDPEHMDQLLSILQAHSLYNISRVGKYMQSDQSIGFEEKWNKHYQADLVKVAHAHAVYLTASSFVNALKERKISDSLKKHLTVLCKIHLAHSIITYADGAILGGYIKGKHLSQIEEFMYDKIEEIRPQLLNLVEAVGYPDGAIGSIIGSTEGDIYEKMYQASAWNPMNAKDGIDSIDQYVKPMSQRLRASL